MHHRSLALKGVPDLSDGTGSIDALGDVVAVPVPPVIITTKTTSNKNTDDKSTDSNNGNDDNIDSEVIVVPKIVTILDKANLNHIEVSVSPTNVTHTKIQTLIKQNSNPLMELRLVR